MEVASTKALYAIFSDYSIDAITKALRQMERAGHIEEVAPPVFLRTSGRNHDYFAPVSIHTPAIGKARTPQHWTDSYVYHRVMISDFCAVTHAFSRKSGYPVTQWFQEKGKRRAKRPDAEFVLNGQKFYLECDRGTEPYHRETSTGSDIWGKYDFYTEKFKAGEKFRVLFDCISLNRMISMLDVAVEHDPMKKGLGIFWFTQHDNIQIDNPDRIFTEPYWFIPTLDKEGKPNDEGQILFPPPKNAPTL